MALLVGGSRSEAALNAYAEIRANGTPITGFTSVASVGGVNVSSGHLECFAVNHEMFKTLEGGTRVSTYTTHAPFKLVKRLDKATPLLYKALSENQVVTGKIKYFKESSDGTTELAFTIELLQGRITGVRHWSPNNLDSEAFNYPQLEEVSIVYGTIRFRDEKTGTEFEMSGNSER